MKTAVIAGTPVDTKMGTGFLNRRNPEIETMYMPFAENPRECHLYQLQPQVQKQEIMKMVMKSAMKKGAESFFIYCNSLSAAVDFETLSKELDISVITPMSAYKKIALSYDCIGVIAANNQACKGIEEAFTSGNSEGYVLGGGNLKLVEAVEKALPPENIVKDFGLEQLCSYFASCGCGAVVLGCTHFPYFKDAIQSVSVLPVIDPAEIMYEMLMRG